ncbi:hypothetical protein [Natronoarchaeum rubrum]|uniref:hypothetical protein n=1 Tax=Natronoarchaeum rubrum TaxID=755311 RepID=UPI0021119995|nr:hypothetical protein [Natronoarchaeum rubrum]
MSEGPTSGIDRYGRQANHPDEFRATADEIETFDGGLALGYLRRLEVLLDACPVRIYAASSLKHPWPYRLQNAAECYPASFWRSQDRILDSAIGKDLSNEEVLDHAVERHATAVVAKDYLHDPEATTESIRKFVDLYDPDVHPRAFVPLQPPYDEHVAKVYPLVEESQLDHRYMLGGLATASPSERIDALLAFRREIGEEPIAHGLGWGLDDELVATIRDEPTLLDSVDNSSPSQAAQNGQVLDKHWQARDCPNVDGKYQNSVHGAFEFAMLVQATHRLTEFNDDFEGLTEQAGLGEFGGVRADD